MKTTLFSFITFLFFTYLAAQDYTPMLTEEKGWTVVQNYWTWGPEEMAYNDYQYRVTEDTFNFNNKEYRAIEYRTRYRTDHTPPTSWSIWASDFYLFEDINLKQVYVYYMEDNHLHHTAGEYLLYDFNLNVGDNIDFTGFNEVNENGSTNIITEVSYESVFGIENVKTYHFNPGDGFDEFKIYEGIGSSTGLVTLSLVIDLGWTLENYGILNTSDISRQQAKIYPNPFTDQIQIKTMKPVQQMDLFEMTGRLITSKKNPEELNLQLRSLCKGIYILTITYKDHQKETVKLIKN